MSSYKRHDSRAEVAVVTPEIGNIESFCMVQCHTVTHAAFVFSMCLVVAVSAAPLSHHLYRITP